MIRDEETIQALVATVERFVNERLRPLEAQVSETDQIPPDVVQDMRCEPEQGPERGSGGRPRPGGAGPPRGGRGDAVGGQSRCRGVGQAGVHTVEGA